MTEIFKLVGSIVIDASGVSTTLDDTSRRTGLFSEKVQSDFRKIAQTAATVFALDKIKDFGMACVKQYADIAAAESAFTQTMGDYTEQATAKLKGLEDQTGIVSSRMMNHFTMLTSRFVGRGYGIEEATDLAAQGMLVAADAAAYYNKSLDETVGHLNSFLNGSYEGGEAIGLYATQVEMAQKAVEQGFITDPKQFQGLKEGEKQVIRLYDAVKQMADSKVTGQSLFESGSYQNELANMKAAAAEASTALGEPLTNDVVLPAITKLGELLRLVIDHKDEISEALSPFTEFLGSLATNSLELLQVALGWVVENKENIQGTFNTISACMLAIGLWTHPAITALSLVVSKWDEITEAVDSAIIAVQRFFGINAGSGVQQGASGVYHGGGAGGGSFESNAPIAVESNVGWDGTSTGFWGIPGFATGLDRVPRDNYIARLHKDEAVLNATNAAVWRNGGSMGNLEAKMDSMLDMLRQIMGYNGQIAANSSKGQSVYIDKGALVGAIAYDMDVALATRASKVGRRNY